MRRREFVSSAFASLVFVRQAQAQQHTKVWRIGFLAGGAQPASVETHHLGGFLEGMRERGYVQGRDFVIEARFADGQFQRFPALAGELVSPKWILLWSARERRSRLCNRHPARFQ